MSLLPQIEVGQTKALGFYDAAGQLSTNLNYRSLNLFTMTVDASGSATAVAPGLAVIEITNTVDGTKVTVFLEVVPVGGKPAHSYVPTSGGTLINGSQGIPSATVGATQQLGLHDGVSTISVTNLQFHSLNPDIATVNTSGLATFVREGSATVVITNNVDNSVNSLMFNVAPSTPHTIHTYVLKADGVSTVATPVPNNAATILPPATLNGTTTPGADVVIPMTANPSGGQTVTVSSNYLGGAYPQFDGWHAFDQQPPANASGWLSDNGAVRPHWIAIDLGSAKTIGGYSITTRNDAPTTAPYQWSLQGSDDGSTWIDLDKRYGHHWASGQSTEEFALSVYTTHRYYRLSVAVMFINPDSTESTQFLSINELSLNASASINAAYPQALVSPTASLVVTPTMDAPMLPWGSATASSSYTSPSYDAWHAFDQRPNVNDSGWISGSGQVLPQWLAYALPNAQTIKAYAITIRPNDTLSAPYSWQFQGSNDGTIWDTLDTRIGERNWTGGERREYALSSASATYTSYRIYITNTQFNSSGQTFIDGYTAINELELLKARTGAAITYVAPADKTTTDSIVSPKMDDAMHPWGAITASSVYNTGFAEWLAFNRDNTVDGWISGSTDINATLRLTLPNVQSVVSYAITVRPSIVGSPYSWVIEGSNDNGTNWTLLDTRLGEEGWGASERREYALTVTGSFSTYRFRNTDFRSAGIDGNQTFVAISELEFRRTLGGSVIPKQFTQSLTPLTYAFPKMRSNTSPYGVVSAVNPYGASGPPFNAFDQEDSTDWISNVDGVFPMRLQYQARAPISTKQYHITIPFNSGATQAPYSWTIEGSNDGIAWTTVDTRTAITNFVANQANIFSFGNTPISYTYWRLNLTAYSPGQNAIHITEFMVYNA
jgi:hypothetical protein